VHQSKIFRASRPSDAAGSSLPNRCREIVVLRKLEGLSQKETAAQLGLSEKTIEEQLSRVA
jgi:RNA polymerase sigma factor (sigma-70 family)